MKTTELLESNMAAAHEEFSQAGTEVATLDDIRNLNGLHVRSLVTVWAMKMRHKVDYDLSSAALQNIK